MATIPNTSVPPDALIFQRIQPRAYLERFLAEGIRPDGRLSTDWRQASVNVGSISTANGSALVRLGDTTIVCGVKAEIAEPELDRPEDGFIVPNVDLPAICSPKFKPGPPGEEAQVLSDRINEILVAANVISAESLCIAAGKAVWVLYIDVVCINYDGNALDAAILAVIAGLHNTRLPKATFDDETERTTCSRSEQTPVVVNCSPLATSFGIFDSKHILCDPSSFEEPLLETSITILTDERGTILSTSQVGLGPRSSPNVLADCGQAATKRRVELDAVLKSS